MAAPQVAVHEGLEVFEPRTNPAETYKQNAPYSEQQIGGHYGPNHDGGRERRLYGLRATTFFLTLALVLVILAAGIGGGVGATSAVNNAKNANSAAQVSTIFITHTITTTAALQSATAAGTTAASGTSSTTTTASLNLPTAGVLALNCPSLNNTETSITLGSTSYAFSISCGTDFNGANVDILAIISYSIADCAQACASYNYDYGQSVCKAVVWNSDLGEVEGHFGNCFLKNDTSGRNAVVDDTYVGLTLLIPT